MSKLPQNWRIIFTIAGLFVLFALLWIFRSIITYMIIAVVLAFICEPLANVLKKIRLKKFVLPAWFRALFSLLVFVVVIGSLLLMFTPLITTEMELLASIDPVEVTEKIQGELAENLDPAITEEIIIKAKEMFSFEYVEGVFQQIFGYIGNFLIGVFAVLFIAFFLLKDGFLFSRIVFTITPEAHMEKIKNIMDHSHKLLRRYFIGLMIQSLIMATMVGISLSLLGVQNALLIGLFAGLVNIIPYLGPWLGAAIGVLIALSTSIQLDFQTEVVPLLVRVVLVFIVAQQIDGFVVQPLVLGNSVKAHPLEIFIVVLMAGTIGGITGMVVAIPVYTILRVVAREFLSEFRVVESLTRDLDDRNSR
ncbi:MAG: AI-2E family transporter [Flavobacteriales bacterium]|nr:AI-2E family transporter [Flavobacteriales bacterium]